jgi:protein-S-isoprenylcysteine O-methyltransferase Ste14
VKLNIATLLLAIVAFGNAAYFIATTHQPWTPIRMGGVAIAVPSFILFLMARVQLGDSFSIQARASTLVTTGIYSRIRNPIYVFAALLIAGLALCFRPVYLVGFVILIPLQIIRSRKEERVLAAAFGDEYRRYKAKTWF